MRRGQMLERLQYSQNAITASMAQRILEGRETIAEAKKMGYGSFMQAVIEGNYEEALCLADDANRRCIAEEYAIEEEQFNEW